MARNKGATEEVAQPEKEVKAESPLDVAIRVGVENWLAKHLRNTPFSQDTGAWNVLQNALPHLAPCITQEVK